MLAFVRRFLCRGSILTVREPMTAVFDLQSEAVKAVKDVIEDVADKIVDACPDAVKDTVKGVVDTVEKTCVEAVEKTSVQSLDTLKTLEKVVEEKVETCAEIVETKVDLLKSAVTAPALKTMEALPPAFIEKMEVLSSRQFKGLPTLPKSPTATD